MTPPIESPLLNSALSDALSCPCAAEFLLNRRKSQCGSKVSMPLGSALPYPRLIRLSDEAVFAPFRECCRFQSCLLTQRRTTCSDKHLLMGRLDRCRSVMHDEQQTLLSRSSHRTFGQCLMKCQAISCKFPSRIEQSSESRWNQ